MNKLFTKFNIFDFDMPMDFTWAYLRCVHSIS